MGTRKSRPPYRHADAVLVRAAVHTDLPTSEWPDLTDTTSANVLRWRAWLRGVWAVDAVAAAIEHASPVLARQVGAICASGQPDSKQARRAVLSTARYLLRLSGRATPFGLFAGVASASLGPGLAVRWCDGHRAVAGADAGWLGKVIAQLESVRALRPRLMVVANNVCVVRGGRLVVPYPARLDGELRAAAAEVSVRYTPAVRAALTAARSPIRGDQLAEKVAAEFPSASPSTVAGLLADLLDRGALISSLRAPSTVADAFGYLIDQLAAAGAHDIPEIADLLERLRGIDFGLARHNQSDSAGVQRRIRADIVHRMAVHPTPRQPVTVDLRLDCTLVLPDAVAREAEAAASALAQLTAHPFGTTAWQSYQERFFEAYGIGALVPVLDVVDPDVGIGFPDGYLGGAPERPAALSDRDGRLLELAQAAALDGVDEIALDAALIADLAHVDLPKARMPPHLELCFQLLAANEESVRRGDFELAIGSVSRGVGTMTGRFLDLLARSDREQAAAVFTRLPTSDPDTVPVQLSFPPLAASAAHVARAPQLLPAVVSVAEHRRPGDLVIPVEDLAVACDGHRLYLASLSLGRRVEPTILHALDLRTQTPPLVRFLAEVGRSQAAVVTGFDWGAASGLPFLPRLRHRRAILSPARWLLAAGELPGRRASWSAWEQALAQWRSRRRLPPSVCLAEGDRRLGLDLQHAGHRAVLRAHLDTAGRAVLTDAPARGANGWFGGHAHEIVMPLMAARPPRWPPVPPVSAARKVGRNHGHPPGASPWLFAKLYGHPDRQTEILAEHLPGLLADWDETPAWWFMRYRDPEGHLRLRIALPDADGFGPAARRVGTWAGQLRCQGLLRDVQFAEYRPESGRWGSGPALAAAEAVFGADSRALLAQFAQRSRPHPFALVTAHFVALAAGFTGNTEAGMTWLINHARTETGIAAGRRVVDDAVRLADPRDDWAALRAEDGGTAIATAFEPRRKALGTYHAHLAGLAGTEGIDPDAVLVSLLHAHHLRARGIDPEGERICLRLARSAALAWAARSGSSPA